MNPDDIQDPLNEDEGEEDEEDDEEAKKHVLIRLRPEKSPLRLEIKYTPSDVEEPRNFELPLRLKGIGELDSLTRVVKGVGVKPRFLLDNTVINFKTTVIAKGSKPPSRPMDIQISNPDLNPIVWSINKEILDRSKVFTMNPTEGRLEPQTNATVRITFNPLEAKEYVEKVPLFLDGDKSKPYLWLEFRGEGVDAKIFFDRREIILPPVPIGVQARATFLVQYTGDENLEVKPKIATEVGKLNIELNFPEGKSLGVMKKKLKVEAVFSNKKPLSFTTHIDFYDEEGNKFPIPISGTTDNSLFTIFSFLQRYSDEVVYNVDSGKPVMLELDATSDAESRDGGPIFQPRAHSKTGASSIFSRSPASLVGFQPVQINLLERNCEYI